MGSTQRLNLILYLCLAEIILCLIFLINSICRKMNRASSLSQVSQEINRTHNQQGLILDKIRPHPPTPSPNFGRRGANLKVPLPSLGEGFRVRAFDSCNKSIVYSALSFSD